MQGVGVLEVHDGEDRPNLLVEKKGGGGRRSSGKNASGRTRLGS